jgi:thiamine transport system permease protein
VVLALAAAPLGFLAVFFAWPLAAILRRGLSAGGVIDALRDPGIRRVAWFTVWQATLSTLLTVVVALPAASVVARYRFPGRRFVQAFITVPFMLPTVVVAAAFLALLPRSWHGTVPAILVAHVFFNYAVVVRTVSSLWQHLDPRLEEAARTLGASRWRTFREVTLPLLRPAIVASASVVFLFTFTSFGIVLLLGGPRHPTLEVEIYRLTAQLLDLRGAAALCVLQVAALGALLVWWTRSQARATAALRLQPASQRRRPRTAGERTWVGANLVVLVVLIGLPVGRLVQRSFTVGNGYGLAWWRLLGRRTSLAVPAIETLRISVQYAVVAMVLAVTLGGLAACAVAYGGRVGPWFDAGLMLPLGTSAVTIGFGLLITMNRGVFDLRSSWVIVPIAQALVAVPFVVRTALPVLRAVDPRQREAAATLGASPRRVWREIDWPVLSRSLLVGAGFAFAISMGEFGATAFLARRGSPTAPVAITELLGRPGASNAGQAYALAVLLAVVVAGVVLLVDGLRSDREGTF